MSIETNGGPGSGRYPKGSGENSSDKVTPDKSKQRLNFKRTGNTMHITKDVNFSSGAKILSGNKITKIVDFAGGKSGENLSKLKNISSSNMVGVKEVGFIQGDRLLL